MRIVVEAADRPRVNSSKRSTKIYADTPLVFQRLRFSKVPDHYHGVTPVLNNFVRLRGSKFLLTSEVEKMDMVM